MSGLPGNGPVSLPLSLQPQRSPCCRASLIPVFALGIPGLLATGPDEETDFAGDPSNPRLGDVKVRVGFRAVSVRGRPLASFFELTLPTASPESLGSGKYQLSVGLRTRLPLAWREGASGQFFSAQIQQVASIAGNVSLWREVKVLQVRDAAANRWRAYAYVSTEAAGSGIQIIDLSGLPNSRISTSAICSASTIAFRMSSTASPASTISPFRTPRATASMKVASSMR